MINKSMNARGNTTTMSSWNAPVPQQCTEATLKMQASFSITISYLMATCGYYFRLTL
jgi:hypothetical protein